jgi:3-oxoacyl-[acyl-carrier protein] reductase
LERRPTVLVTGANTGIGKVITSRLALTGYDVALNYKVDEAGATKLATELEQASGGRMLAVYADVGHGEDVDRMFATILARFDRLDALVNNAAVQVQKPLLELEESDWDFVLNTNVKGYFLCLQRAARHMKGRHAGSIVNIGSGSNKLPFPNLSSYSVSKAGIDMLTKAAAVELGPFGIRVNCIGPGAIDTERTRRETSDFVGKWAKLTPLRRIGTPEDIAGAVEFLLSEKASFINGQTFWVDGGLFTAAPWPEDYLR